MKKLLCLMSAALFLTTVGFALAAAGGEELYRACAGCHGADGSRTVGDGVHIKGEDADTILKQLNGYADGNYGGSQKAIMANVAKKLSADERKALADHIATFK